MPYEEQAQPVTSKKSEIQVVLDEMRNSNELLHKEIEELSMKLEPIMKEETDSKEAEGHPPFITKLGQEFDTEVNKIKLARSKIRKIRNRLEI